MGSEMCIRDSTQTHRNGTTSDGSARCSEESTDGRWPPRTVIRMTKNHTLDNRLSVSKKDAAFMLGLSVRTVEYLVAEGRIATFTVGRRRLFPVAALRGWVEQQAEATFIEECM